jgi:hypothetical protein
MLTSYDIMVSFPLTTKPYGCGIYFKFEKSSLKKVVLISICATREKI